MTLEKVYKMHLLRCLKPFPDGDVVEHSCATDQSKSYADTVRAVKARMNRLRAGGNGTESQAFMADRQEIKCWGCGQKGHRLAECRVRKGKEHQLQSTTGDCDLE